MVRVYQKLGFNKTMHWTRRVRLLRQKYCPVFNEIIKNDIRNIPKVFAPEVEFIEDIEVIEDDNQERWIIKLRRDNEDEIVEGEVTEVEMGILDLVLYDEMKETEDAGPPRLPSPHETIEGEEVDPAEYERQMWDERRKPDEKVYTENHDPRRGGTSPSDAPITRNLRWLLLGIATFLLILWFAGDRIRAFANRNPTPTDAADASVPPASLQTSFPTRTPGPMYLRPRKTPQLPKLHRHPSPFR
jgi:hypothetical protein